MNGMRDFFYIIYIRHKYIVTMAQRNCKIQILTYHFNSTFDALFLFQVERNHQSGLETPVPVAINQF